MKMDEEKEKYYKNKEEVKKNQDKYKRQFLNKKNGLKKGE